jgi:hypothetical protein
VVVFSWRFPLFPSAVGRSRGNGQEGGKVPGKWGELGGRGVLFFRGREGGEGCSLGEMLLWPLLIVLVLRWCGK